MTSTVRPILVGNFFSSVAAGVVLARGLSLMKEIPGFFGDSIITFLVGGFIAFGMVAQMRSTGSRAVWPLSAAALLVSAALAVLSQKGIGPGPGAHIALFGLMSMFFATTLSSRSLRSDLAAFEHSKLPLAEVAYSAGYLVGLGIISLGFAETLLRAFLAASLCLAITVCADIFAKAQSLSDPASVGDAKEHFAPLSRGDWMLALQFGLMTLGVQIFLQRYSSWTDSSLPLAAFEIGVLAATIIAAIARPSLIAKGPSQGLLTASLSAEGRKLQIPTGIAFTATLIAPGLGALLVTAGLPALLAALLFLLSSFSYEYLSLALLQHIGRNRGNVAFVFAATAVFSTVIYAASMLALRN